MKKYSSFEHWCSEYDPEDGLLINEIFVARCAWDARDAQVNELVEALKECVSETRPREAQLEEALRKSVPYIRHHPECEYNHAGECDCGRNNLRVEINSLLNPDPLNPKGMK